MHAHPRASLLMPVGFVALAVLIAPLLVFMRRVTLRVGADGLLVRQGLARSVFYPHEAITKVNAEGHDVVIHLKRGEPLRFGVGVQTQGRAKNPRLAEEQARQAKSIVWRVQKARDAYEALAGSAPQAALALSRGQRSVHDWIEALRRVGEGDGATFRDALPTRDQLLAVVESTTAAAKERLAAVIALQSKLTEDEKPRLRVAAERCVAPDLRERMVRVIDAEADEELAAVLEEADRAESGHA
jgi:PH (Pleckstrin Homology) domain-containing protein